MRGTASRRIVAASVGETDGPKTMPLRLRSMTETTAITIDLAEEFPHLSRAPIVEAVIDLRTRAETPWEESDVTSKLKVSLPDYPNVASVRAFSLNMSFQLGSAISAQPMAGEPSHAEGHDRGWIGVRCTSRDGLNIATFTRDGFALSRLRPYENWVQFRDEAMRLWAIHAAAAGVSEVARLAVRFINRLEIPRVGLDFGDYLDGLGDSPGHLPSAGFMYHDVLAVPGHPYQVNVVRTTQPSEAADLTMLALILDVDAFHPEPFRGERRTIEQKLAHLHWLKNRVFFKSVTPKFLDLCR